MFPKQCITTVNRISERCVTSEARITLHTTMINSQLVSESVNTTAQLITDNMGFVGVQELVSVLVQCFALILAGYCSGTRLIQLTRLPLLTMFSFIQVALG